MMSSSKNKPPALFLTVCISCREKADLLEQNLKALSRQTLSKNLWNIALLFRETSPTFLNKLLNDLELSAQIFIQPKNQPIHELRNQAFQKINSPLLFFIDEDVILNNTDHLRTLVHLHEQHPKWTVLGGGYVSSTECSFWGRTYNWISRIWMGENPGFMPAGNLSVKTQQLKPSCRFKSPLKKGFGGEEIYFFNQIKSLDLYSVQKTELDALHLARHSFREFLSRAVLHGQSRAFQKSRRSFYKSLLYFIKQPESFSVKTAGGLYMLFVRVTSSIYKNPRQKPYTNYTDRV
ncbi:MAG: glycosyltransferase [Bdellovibrionales bacterium]|nr:glycosyltransferase [Bdellovibrionales bacterium]